MPNIFNFLNTLKNIHFDRKKQLDKQKLQDEKLKFLYSKCPENVMKYYYFQRVLNRVLTKNLNDSDIISYLQTLQKNYEIIDEDIKQFEKFVLDSNNINTNFSCHGLNVYNQKYLLKNIIYNISDFYNDDFNNVNNVNNINSNNYSKLEKYLGKY